MSVVNREQFKEYCLRRLGAPTLRIAVAPDQIEDSVDAALYLFFSRHMDATEEKYIAHVCTPTEVTNGYIIMPPATQSVQGVWRNHGGSYSSSVFGVPYQIFLGDYLSNNGIYSSTGGIFDIYLTTRHITMLNDFFSPDVRFNYNKMTRKLRIDGLDLSLYQEAPIIINTLERIATEEEIAGTEDSGIWEDTWLKAYATAQLKRYWGTNLKKHQGVKILGDVMLDGKTIFDEAEIEIQNLEDELSNSYEMPIDFEIG
jgi:hypothetical protein